MNSIRKVYSIFVLLMLLFSMIPAAVADGEMKGTDDKIDILYIGWEEYDMLNMKISEDMPLYYKDDFSIVICDFYDYYDLTQEELASYDIIICDMIFFGGVDAETLAKFKAAKESGVTLVAVMNEDASGTTVTPDFFDFRDTIELTQSTNYAPETIKTFFSMFEASKTYTDIDSDISKQLQSAWTENILMFLAKVNSEESGSAKEKEIVQKWNDNRIKITYMGFTGQENWGIINQYSSFMDVTFLKDYWTPDGEKAIADFANSGRLKDQDLIIINMITEASIDQIDKSITNADNKLRTLANAADIPVYFIQCGEISTFVTIDDEYGESRANKEMSEQLLVFGAVKYETDKKISNGITENWILKKGMPTYGIYHPNLQNFHENAVTYIAEYSTDPLYTGRHTYNASNATVGIWFHKSYFSDGRVKIIDALIHDLESKGVNVIAGFDVFQDTESGNPMMKYYADKNGNVLIHSAISIKDFALNYQNYEDGVEWLEELDVVVMKAVIASTGGSITEIPKDMLIYSTVSPNRDGMGDFILLGNVGEDGPEAFEEQKDWLANRAIKWAELKIKENENKRVVIMYYNYPPGKDGVGANYLNVIKSFAGASDGNKNNGGILREMKDAGYTVSYGEYGLPIQDEDDLNDEILLDLIMQQGINVGSYAPGVLNTMVEARGDIEDDKWWGATLVPVEKYKKWFDETIQNETIRDQVIEAWGEPWDYAKPLDKDQSGMIWEDETGKRYFVLPAIRLGNVYLMPQPDRALATDKAFSYHSGDIPPTHQYIAYYLWLNNDFKPDALVNFGTHGTHEWLPGSAHGLSATDDLSPLLLKDIPNIYPYIVANVGEGLTAEYRGNALIIDHMTPPMLRSNLESNADLYYLETEIQAYFIGSDGATDKERQNNIVDRMFKAEIHNVIGTEKHKKAINSANPGSVTDDEVKTYLKELPKTQFSIFLKDDLYDYIETIKESTLPYGMHTYGQSPTNIQIAAMLRAMWGEQFDAALYEAYYKDEGYLGVPYDDEDEIHKLVIDLSKETDASEMMKILEKAYPASKYPSANHDTVIHFLLGPRMYLSGASNVNDVMAEWDSTGITKELTDEILFAYYFYAEIPPTDAEIKPKIEEVVDYYIKNKGSGKSDAELINEALSSVFKTQSHQNKAVVGYLTGYGRLKYAENLEACGDSEMKSFMKALSGGYITPNAGNDPIQNPSAIPTGKNFYGIDPTKFPTKPAWEVGKSLADQTLADYYLKYGEFPNTVSFSRFGVEFIRDEGALEACALYLLGVEPVWDANGNVDPKSVRVIDLEDLKLTYVDEKGVTQTINRPRIDIVYATAGMRDAFGDKLKLINVAVKTVSLLNEDPERNYVKANSDALAAAGFGDLAYMRCFANELGNYEIGTGNLVSASGSWESSDAIAEMYLNKMGYVYGDDSTWGVQARSLLEALLKKTDASIHADSSNLYDTLDNDDFFQYFGALNLATKYVRDDNKLPEMYVADTRNVGQNARFNAGKIYGMKEYLNIDMESRYLNEEWIKGMMESGYSGSTMYSEFVDNLFGWAATSDGALVSFKNWEAVYDIYVEDKYNLGLNEYFENNPYAYQSIAARMLETMRHGLMTSDELTGDQKIKMAQMHNSLLEKYIDSVIQSGVACCHHTCGNPKFSAFVDGEMSVLAADPEKEEQYLKYLEYKDILEQAVPPTPEIIPSPSGNSGAGYGTAALSSGGTPAEAASAPAEAAGEGYGTEGGQAGEGPSVVTGYEMTVLETVAGSIRNFVSNPTVSASNIVVLAGIVLLVGAVFYGFRRKGI